MVVDQINIKVTADSTAFNQNLKQIEGQVKIFDKSITGVSGSVDGFAKTIKSVNFLTMTTGMLNLSTSAAQVYTSFSNLDRASNQVQSSLVALHKAEDQILRKQTQLSQAIEKYGANSERAAMISGELGTAQEQLAVKTERHRLAIDQLTDTYILMASNLANTTFGALQTFNILLSASQKATLLNILGTNSHTLAIKLNKIALDSQMRSYMGNTSAVKLNALETKISAGMSIFDAGAKKASAFATIQATIATKGLTASIRSLLASIPIVGWAALGVIAIYEAYTLNVGGLGDGINKLLGIQDKEKQALDEQNKMMKDLNDTMGDTSAETDKLFNSNVKLAGVSSIMKNTIKDITNATIAYKEYANTVNNTVGNSNMSISSFGKINPINPTNSTPTNLTTTSSSQINLPSSINSTGSNERYAALQLKLAPFEKSFQTENYAKAFAAEISNVLGETVDLTKMKEFIGLEQEALDIHLKDGSITQDMYDIQSKGLSIARDRLMSERGISSELGKQVNSAKAYEQLKKKLLSEYGFIEAGKNRRSFVAGDTNYFMGEDGLPFAGIINKKTNELQISIESRNAFDIMGYALDYSNERVMNGTMTPVEAAQYIRGVTANLNKQRNIISSLSGNNIINDLFKKVSANVNNGAQISQSFTNMLMSTTTEFERLSQAYEIKNKPNINIRNQSNSNPYGNYANPGFATGKPSNSARFKIDPSFAIARRAKDAFANSAIGQSIFAARSLLTGGSFMFTGTAGRAAAKSNSFDSTSLMMAGLLGFYPSDDSSVSSMVQESVDFLASNMSSIPTSMRNSAFASILRNSAAKDAYILPMGYSYIRDQRSSKLGDERARAIRASKASMLNTLINRFNTGNYGEYDATLMQVLLSGDFAHPELQQEYNSFQSNIAPKLGISFSQFGSTLSDTQRGYNEIDDRLRYYDRLAAISTGATAF